MVEGFPFFGPVQGYACLHHLNLVGLISLFWASKKPN